jgi:hypothetical protein
MAKVHTEKKSYFRRVPIGFNVKQVGMPVPVFWQLTVIPETGDFRLVF